MKKAKNLLIGILAVVVAIFFIRDCNSGRKKEIKEKVTVHIAPVKEPIKTIEIGAPRKVNYQVFRIKGKDSIIYRDTATGETREALQYDTQLKSNNATADLKITTTGELIDVTGTIEYPEKTVTIERDIPVNTSGLFAWVQTDASLQLFGVGLDYQFKNKVMAGAGLLHVDNNTYVVGKVGLKIW